MNSPADVLPCLEAYYDSNRKDYWILDRGGTWIEVTESSLRRHLKGAGLSPECPRNALLSEIDQKLNDFQLKCAVAYAGPLAGCRKGVCEMCDLRILVTSSPRLIEPHEGKFPLISKVVENLFNDRLLDQRPYVLGWLKVAYEALKAGARRPGQALVMAGPPNSGKSLWQNITTVILGGRAAKPYRYMCGDTAFNADLFGAEHLMIEDECGSTDLRSRREFGARIKDFTVNEVQSCHAKNRQAISLRPWWRLSVSVNDEPENLVVLPPLDESLIDKIILLRTTAHPMPMETDDIQGRTRFWQALMDELPGFMAHLVQWTIPPQLRCPRFGVKTWQHPHLLEAIDALSPELRLLSLIDSVLFGVTGPAPGPRLLTAEALERELVHSSVQYEARRLLSWSNACGTYLGRLARKRPLRIEQDRTSECRQWRINPPQTG